MRSSAAQGPVLIAEDDRKTAALVQLYLEREGFETIIANDGLEALKLARDRQPVFVILDLMLPMMDGWEVCREIRKKSEVPIIMLTARGDEVDRISGLTLGADDYVVKPFSPRELVARVKAILRRSRLTLGVDKNLLSHGELVMDLEKRRVTLQGHSIRFTPHELKLLEALMASPGRVFSRDELLDRLYPSGELVVDRVIDVHIGKIRQKIEKDPSTPRYIQTVRGLGYRFADRGES